MPQSSGGKGRDYRESDLRTLLSRRPDFRSWDDVMTWLRSEGPRDGELMRAADRDQMLEDLWWLRHDGVPFTADPGEAFRLAHEHRPSSRELREVGVGSPHRAYRGEDHPPSAFNPDGYFRRGE